MQSTVQASSIEVALAILRRRLWLVLLIVAPTLAVTIAVAIGLPNIYQSTATVLVAHPQAPQNLAGPSAPDDLDTRIRTISQQIMSRSRLWELATQLNLYPELRRRSNQEAIAQQMRRAIRLESTGGRQTNGSEETIAFSLSYRGRDPQTVARVTNALAALYVEENTKIRAQSTAGTAEILRAQIEDAQRQLDIQERKISEFKQRHMGELPEQQLTNLAALERRNSQLRVILDREESLAKGLGLGAAGGDTTMAQLPKLRQELANLRSRYTDEHPDVVRVKQEITDLEHQLVADGGKRTTAGDPTAREGTDARAAVGAELTALRKQEQAIRREIATYEQRIEAAPLRELELQQLSRDAALAKDLYQSLVPRYQNALLTERIEQRQGEQFRILDSAVASRTPVAPQRGRLLLMGLMGSLGAAMGMALLAEARDTSCHTVDDVRAVTSVPVLVSIPPIVTGTDVRRRLRQGSLAALAATSSVIALADASFHLARSNDVLIGLVTRGHF
jgi:polysaccharide chain length determinant protein (PEP-CTERM system associated)